MNKDFRVAITIATHCKTKKLMRRLGDRSFYNLVRLWAYAAANKPNGKLIDMNEEDIEIAADWNGECSKFTLALLELKFIEKADDVFSIYNWEKHNGYAFHAQQRSEKAQFLVFITGKNIMDMHFMHNNEVKRHKKPPKPDGINVIKRKT
jgi:hypothetical protein